jgi:hypothetical protein
VGDYPTLFGYPDPGPRESGRHPIEDVPVFVDASIASNLFPIVRCSYLTIETNDPDPNWQLGTGTQAMPMLLFRLAAIVMQPFDAELFTEPRHFEDLLRRIESNSRWSVESADVWLPLGLFHEAKWSPSPGQVYRVGHTLFSMALRYRNGEMSQEDFSERISDMWNQLRLSEDETRAFQQWHASVMEEQPSDKDAEFGLHDRGEQ